MENLMESLSARRWATNRDYWIKLSHAADANGTADTEQFVPPVAGAPAGRFVAGGEFEQLSIQIWQ
jgi:hypothetical protein